jgi:electron transfer flavoprotein alpha subunit
MTEIMVVAETDRAALAPATLEALAAARGLAGDAGDGSADIAVVVCGPLDGGDEAIAVLGAHGAGTVHHAEHALLHDYGPETWGATVAQLIDQLHPDVVLACGTSKGNEVLAQAAARLDAPFVANCTAIDDDATAMTRVQWGGSLLERGTLEADVRILSVAPHAFEAASDDDADGPPAAVEPFEPDLDPALARTVCVGREIAEAGVTLSTAPIVFGGGRGVGSPEGFAALEEAARLLGGRVGCSRAVTNNGWRPHSDQVGQTGTRIAPELYVASGISGAIQHWVGAMASKKILAINTDPQANMVVKSDYHVIGDLHEVVPAVIAEIRRRQA